MSSNVVRLKNVKTFFKLTYGEIYSIYCDFAIIFSAMVEESGMLGDIQGGFRMGRRTEDNLFMLERMIEMAKVKVRKP